MQDYLEMRGSDMIIFVPEELDHHNAEKIRRASDAMMQSRRVKNVVFDFRDTIFMDSAGIGMIMGRYRQIYMLGGEICAAHANERVKKILTMSGVTKIMEIIEEDQ